MSAVALWDQLVMTHRMTQVSREAIRNPGLAQVFRDEAVQALVHQTDRLLAQMDRLSEQQQLTQIGTLLRRRGI